MSHITFLNSNAEGQEPALDEETKNSSIKELGSITTKDGKHRIFCLTIIGEIEGHSILPQGSKTTKYEHVLPLLVSIEEEKEIDGLLVILNTVGGDFGSRQSSSCPKENLFLRRAKIMPS